MAQASPDRAARMERRVRWAGWIFLVWAVLLVPWTVYLAAQLPRRALAHNYDVAWAGFDLGMVLVLGAAAIAAFRANRWLPPLAAAAATLLLVDAWFDVMTSPPRDRAVAIAMAALVEIPMAGACIWLARHAQHLVEWRAARRARRAG